MKLPAIYSVLLLFAAKLSAADALNPALQRALFEEEANQNYEAAIRAYESVLATHDNERKLAATALFRLGECYRKLGKTNDAIAQFQKLVARFPDQTTLANLSRQNLVGLGSLPASGANVAPGSDSRAELPYQDSALAELAQMEALIAQLETKSRTELKGILPTVAPDAQLDRLVQRIGELEGTLSTATTTFSEEHPNVKELRRRIVDLEKQIDERMNGVIAGLKVKAEALARRADTLKQQAGPRSTPEPSRPDPRASAQLKELLASELSIAEQFAAEQRKKVQAGTLATGDDIRFERDVLNLKRQLVAADGLATPEDRQQWRELLQQEITLAEKATEFERTKLEAGKTLASEVARLQRDVLILKRELLTFDATAAPSTRPSSSAAAVPPAEVITDEEEKEIRRIQALIRNSPDLINAQNVQVGVTRSGENQYPKFGSPLHKAAQQGQLQVATFLLNNGAQLGVFDQMAYTPLHWAAANGHRAMVELLLNRGADVNEVVTLGYPEGGSSPLQLAVTKGYVTVCELLLKRGANPNVGSSRNVPLFSAASRGSTTLVQLLLTNGADIRARSEEGSSALHFAASTNVMSLLLQAGAEPNAQENRSGFSPLQTPLHWAAYGNRVPQVELLLRYKADPKIKDSEGRTPLHQAAFRGASAVIAALVKAGADPNARDGRGSSPLDRSIPENKGTRRDLAPSGSLVETATALLAAGANPNLAQDGAATPLYNAVVSESVEIVEALLKGGAHPNVIVAYDSGNRTSTPLIAAINNNVLSLVTLLLDYKADPNFKTAAGDPPLLFAMNNNRTLIVDLLLQRGADVEAILAGASGETPLGFASRYGQREIGVLLLKHKANPNAKSRDGKTPLHYAVASGKPELVDLLIAAKADPNAVDDAGLTPLDYVKQNVNPNSPRFSGFGGVAVPSFPGRSSASSETSARPLADKLRQAGAKDWAPRPNQITLIRRSTGASKAVFIRGTNNWNRHTVYELLASSPFCAGCPEFQFPDFTKVRITRIGPDAKSVQDFTVDWEELVAADDCKRDAWLQWGDLIDIPEREHKLNERWSGLQAPFARKVAGCVERTITLKVKGQTHTVPLKASATTQPSARPGELPDWRVNLPSLRLRDAVLNSGLVLTTSDLTRVAVDRSDPVTFKSGRFTFDLTQADGPASTFWLLDRDAIEVPDLNPDGASSQPPSSHIQTPTTPNIIPGIGAPPSRRPIRSEPER